MMPSKQLIATLQDHFTERGRLNDAKTTIKCYCTETSSFFFSYKDGWGNKKYVNLPFTPDDVLPILQKYIDNIDKDIIYTSIDVEIDSEDDLKSCIKELKKDLADASADVDFVKSQLKKTYAHRAIVEGTAEDNVGDTNYHDKPYYICAFNSGHKFYEFWLVGRCKNTLRFGFNGVTDK